MLAASADLTAARQDSPSLEDKLPIRPKTRSASDYVIRDRFDGNSASCFPG
jgi:hypothetical protein